MNTNTYQSAAAFLERAEAFLSTHEAANNLLLGVVSELIGAPQLYGADPPYLATVEQQGSVVAAAIRTPPHALTISLIAAAQRDAALAALAESAAAPDPALPSISGPGDVVRSFAQIWTARSGRPHHRQLALRIYQLTEVSAPAGVAGQLRRAEPRDREPVARWLRAFQEDAFGAPVSEERVQAAADRWMGTSTRALYFWEIEGRPVSMAGHSGPTPHGMRISAVYTPPELRGRGYASACVAALSQQLLDSGRTYCFLFTDLANPTSNSIYQRIGYRPVCDVDDIVFEERPAS
jgi:predicted GNAT family acetyltransferase